MRPEGKQNLQGLGWCSWQGMIYTQWVKAGAEWTCGLPVGIWLSRSHLPGWLGSPPLRRCRGGDDRLWVINGLLPRPLSSSLCVSVHGAHHSSCQTRAHADGWAGMLLSPCTCFPQPHPHPTPMADTSASVFCLANTKSLRAAYLGWKATTGVCGYVVLGGLNRTWWPLNNARIVGLGRWQLI